MTVLYAWLRRHPKLVDGSLAAVLAFVGTASALATGLWWLLLPALGLAAPIVYRRAHPTGAFVVGVVAGALQVLLDLHPSPPDLAVVVLLYTLAAYRPPRISVAGLAVCLAGSAVAVARWTPGRLNLLDSIAFGSVLFAGPALIAWVLGDSMRYRRAYYANLEERAARLERERDAQAQIAAAAERARIARELHDVVAHHVSVMVVQADGASYTLSADPDRARQALAAISQTGRQALAEMRRLLGVLRREADGDQAGRAPLPGIGQIEELLEQARASGLSVSFTVDGVPAQLPSGAELAAYRIVQESLTNTRKHGGLQAAAQVRLEYLEDSLVLTVTDDGRGAAAASDGAGHGLAGMRERVAVYGGSVAAGPRPGGGFAVTARLPLAAEPEACPQAAGATGRARVAGSGAPRQPDAATAPSAGVA